MREEIPRSRIAPGADKGYDNEESRASQWKLSLHTENS